MHMYNTSVYVYFVSILLFKPWNVSMSHFCKTSVCLCSHFLIQEQRCILFLFYLIKRSCLLLKWVNAWKLTLTWIWVTVSKPVYMPQKLDMSWNERIFLKGVFAKNERGYRLNAIKKRFWSLLILFLSVASIRRKLIKMSHTEERSAHTNWGSWNIRLRPYKIKLISNKSFRYYNP